ncbi:MogA/MoaB family molybdenum cofactor biosynthesis protein [Hoyosella rhizosphaerae]|uniref:Molybdenum cofactor biosynthesis protein n=1 Tax=Hoyosella rhizosphaerae TaxID=1755582 RepID=A0A916XG29_9ACTN|nr:MogA/MoaB family molybdenum cofactor biosynthesis protein [Hoyosella rhizosphaerae]MBN4925784.1 MogA/MoaB family molybdenum cofactor biosynthesis protein [Hoyosella rhizosphaerae]GGC67992.1 molybdenum cofactor biosynthesis protein [Hoyosella rhizosphaerae]
MEIETSPAGRALVVIVDDRHALGERPETIGPLVRELLTESGFHVDAIVAVNAEEVEIRNALNTAVIGGVDLVISIGGTGSTARDVTPEATDDILDRELPGVAEAIRASGRADSVLDAALSRGLAGVSGSTVVINFASSRAAVRDGMATIGPLVSHVLAEQTDFEG